MSETKTWYVTTPIYYVNDKPHIGHFYTTMVGDVVARYAREHNGEAFFLTGTDEHGDKVARKAKDNGQDPQNFVDENAERFRDAWETLHIDYDWFIRTTDERHERFVRWVLERLRENEALYESDYEGLYCVGAESFVTEYDLREGGLCPDHDEKPQMLKERSWFFALSDYKEHVYSLVKEDHIQVVPETRKNETLELLKNPDMGDIAITRNRVEWGVTAPFDEEQTVYVWIDALLNYLSGPVIAYDIPFEGREVREVLNDLAQVWPPDVQTLGKDILKFHTVLWPAMLLALGCQESELPHTFLVNGFLVSDGEKMSKSKGNVIDPRDVHQTYSALLGGERGSEVLRYFLLEEFALGTDGDITLEKLEERYTHHLVNGLGNTTRRITGMARKYGVELEPEAYERLSHTLEETYHTYMSAYAFQDALQYLWHLLEEIDHGIETVKPWELKKQRDWETLTKEMSKWYATLAFIARALRPFMPQSSDLLEKQLTGADDLLFPKIEQ
jgi:methionyl-tRNA synthetase